MSSLAGAVQCQIYLDAPCHRRARSLHGAQAPTEPVSRCLEAFQAPAHNNACIVRAAPPRPTITTMTLRQWAPQLARPSPRAVLWHVLYGMGFRSPCSAHRCTLHSASLRCLHCRLWRLEHRTAWYKFGSCASKQLPALARPSSASYCYLRRSPRLVCTHRVIVV
jgi:hypothetical protein